MQEWNSHEVSACEWRDESSCSCSLSPQIEVLNKHLFITAKPVVYLVNLTEKDYIRKKNKW